MRFLSAGLMVITAHNPCEGVLKNIKKEIKRKFKFVYHICVIKNQLTIRSEIAMF